MMNKEKIQLSEEQLLMLNMSENDILNGRLTSQEELDKTDLEWLKTYSKTLHPYKFH